MNCFNDNDIGGAMAGAATMAAGAGFKEEIGKSPLTRVTIVVPSFDKSYNL